MSGSQPLLLGAQTCPHTHSTSEGVMSRIHAFARLWGEREEEGPSVFSRSGACGGLLGALRPVVLQSARGCTLPSRVASVTLKSL